MKMNLVNTITDEVVATGFSVTKTDRQYAVNGVPVSVTVYPAFPDCLFVCNSEFAYVTD